MASESEAQDSIFNIEKKIGGNLTNEADRPHREVETVETVVKSKDETPGSEKVLPSPSVSKDDGQENYISDNFQAEVTTVEKMEIPETDKQFQKGEELEIVDDIECEKTEEEKLGSYGNEQLQDIGARSPLVEQIEPRLKIEGGESVGIISDQSAQIIIDQQDSVEDYLHDTNKETKCVEKDEEIGPLAAKNNITSPVNQVQNVSEATVEHTKTTSAPNSESEAKTSNNDNGMETKTVKDDVVPATTDNTSLLQTNLEGVKCDKLQESSNLADELKGIRTSQKPAIKHHIDLQTIGEVQEKTESTPSEERKEEVTVLKHDEEILGVEVSEVVDYPKQEGDAEKSLLQQNKLEEDYPEKLLTEYQNAEDILDHLASVDNKPQVDENNVDQETKSSEKGESRKPEVDENNVIGPIKQIPNTPEKSLKVTEEDGTLYPKLEVNATEKLPNDPEEHLKNTTGDLALNTEVKGEGLNKDDDKVDNVTISNIVIVQTELEEVTCNKAEKSINLVGELTSIQTITTSEILNKDHEIVKEVIKETDVNNVTHNYTTLIQTDSDKEKSTETENIVDLVSEEKEIEKITISEASEIEHEIGCQSIGKIAETIEPTISEEQKETVIVINVDDKIHSRELSEIHAAQEGGLSEIVDHAEQEGDTDHSLLQKNEEKEYPERLLKDDSLERNEASTAREKSRSTTDSKEGEEGIEHKEHSHDACVQDKEAAATATAESIKEEILIEKIENSSGDIDTGDIKEELLEEGNASFSALESSEAEAIKHYHESEKEVEILKEDDRIRETSEKGDVSALSKESIREDVTNSEDDNYDSKKSEGEKSEVVNEYECSSEEGNQKHKNPEKIVDDLSLKRDLGVSEQGQIQAPNEAPTEKNDYDKNSSVKLVGLGNDNSDEVEVTEKSEKVIMDVKTDSEERPNEVSEKKAEQFQERITEEVEQDALGEDAKEITNTKETSEKVKKKEGTAAIQLENEAGKEVDSETKTEASCSDIQKENLEEEATEELFSSFTENETEKKASEDDNGVAIKLKEEFEQTEAIHLSVETKLNSSSGASEPQEDYDALTTSETSNEENSPPQNTKNIIECSVSVPEVKEIKEETQKKEAFIENYSSSISVIKIPSSGAESSEKETEEILAKEERITKDSNSENSSSVPEVSDNEIKQEILIKEETTASYLSSISIIENSSPKYEVCKKETLEKEEPVVKDLNSISVTEERDGMGLREETKEQVESFNPPEEKGSGLRNLDTSLTQEFKLEEDKEKDISTFSYEGENSTLEENENFPTAGVEYEKVVTVVEANLDPISDANLQSIPSKELEAETVEAGKTPGNETALIDKTVDEKVDTPFTEKVTDFESEDRSTSQESHSDLDIGKGGVGEEDQKKGNEEQCKPPEYEVCKKETLEKEGPIVKDLDSISVTEERDEMGLREENKEQVESFNHPEEKGLDLRNLDTSFTQELKLEEDKDKDISTFSYEGESSTPEENENFPTAGVEYEKGVTVVEANLDPISDENLQSIPSKELEAETVEASQTPGIETALIDKTTDEKVDTPFTEQVTGFESEDRSTSQEGHSDLDIGKGGVGEEERKKGNEEQCKPPHETSRDKNEQKYVITETKPEQNDLGHQHEGPGKETEKQEDAVQNQPPEHSTDFELDEVGSSKKEIIDNPTDENRACELETYEDEIPINETSTHSKVPEGDKDVLEKEYTANNSEEKVADSVIEETTFTVKAGSQSQDHEDTNDNNNEHLREEVSKTTSVKQEAREQDLEGIEIEKINSSKLTEEETSKKYSKEDQVYKGSDNEDLSTCKEKQSLEDQPTVEISSLSEPGETVIYTIKEESEVKFLNSELKQPTGATDFVREVESKNLEDVTQSSNVNVLTLKEKSDGDTDVEKENIRPVASIVSEVPDKEYRELSTNESNYMIVRAESEVSTKEAEQEDREIKTITNSKEASDIEIKLKKKSISEEENDDTIEIEADKSRKDVENKIEGKTLATEIFNERNLTTSEVLLDAPVKSNIQESLEFPLEGHQSTSVESIKTTDETSLQGETAYGHSEIVNSSTEQITGEEILQKPKAVSILEQSEFEKKNTYEEVQKYGPEKNTGETSTIDDLKSFHTGTEELIKIQDDGLKNTINDRSPRGPEEKAPTLLEEDQGHIQEAVNNENTSLFTENLESNDLRKNLASDAELVAGASEDRISPESSKKQKEEDDNQDHFPRFVEQQIQGKELEESEQKTQNEVETEIEDKEVHNEVKEDGGQNIIQVLTETNCFNDVHIVSTELETLQERAEVAEEFLQASISNEQAETTNLEDSHSTTVGETTATKLTEEETAAEELSATTVNFSTTVKPFEVIQEEIKEEVDISHNKTDSVTAEEITSDSTFTKSQIDMPEEAFNSYLGDASSNLASQLPQANAKNAVKLIDIVDSDPDKVEEIKPSTSPVSELNNEAPKETEETQESFAVEKQEAGELRDTVQAATTSRCLDVEPIIECEATSHPALPAGKSEEKLQTPSSALPSNEQKSELATTIEMIDAKIEDVDIQVHENLNVQKEEAIELEFSGGRLSTEKEFHIDRSSEVHEECRTLNEVTKLESPKREEVYSVKSLSESEEATKKIIEETPKLQFETRPEEYNSVSGISECGKSIEKENETQKTPLVEKLDIDEIKETSPVASGSCLSLELKPVLEGDISAPDTVSVGKFEEKESILSSTFPTKELDDGNDQKTEESTNETEIDFHENSDVKNKDIKLKVSDFELASVSGSQINSLNEIHEEGYGAVHIDTESESSKKKEIKTAESSAGIKEVTENPIEENSVLQSETGPREIEHVSKVSDSEEEDIKETNETQKNLNVEKLELYGTKEAGIGFIREDTGSEPSKKEMILVDDSPPESKEIVEKLIEETLDIQFKTRPGEIEHIVEASESQKERIKEADKAQQNVTVEKLDQEEVKEAGTGAVYEDPKSEPTVRQEIEVADSPSGSKEVIERPNDETSDLQVETKPTEIEHVSKLDEHEKEGVKEVDETQQNPNAEKLDVDGIKEAGIELISEDTKSEHGKRQEILVDSPPGSKEVTEKPIEETLDLQFKTTVGETNHISEESKSEKKSIQEADEAQKNLIEEKLDLQEVKESGIAAVSEDLKSDSTRQEIEVVDSPSGSKGLTEKPIEETSDLQFETRSQEIEDVSKVYETEIEGVIKVDETLQNQDTEKLDLDGIKEVGLGSIHEDTKSEPSKIQVVDSPPKSEVEVKPIGETSDLQSEIRDRQIQHAFEVSESEKGIKEADEAQQNLIVENIDLDEVNEVETRVDTISEPSEEQEIQAADSPSGCKEEIEKPIEQSSKVSKFEKEGIKEADENQNVEKLDLDEVKEVTLTASKSSCLGVEPIIEAEVSAPEAFTAVNFDEEVRKLSPTLPLDDGMNETTSLSEDVIEKQKETSNLQLDESPISNEHVSEVFESENQSVRKEDEIQKSITLEKLEIDEIKQASQASQGTSTKSTFLGDDLVIRDINLAQAFQEGKLEEQLQAPSSALPSIKPEEQEYGMRMTIQKIDDNKESDDILSVRNEEVTELKVAEVGIRETKESPMDALIEINEEAQDTDFVLGDVEATEKPINITSNQQLKTHLAPIKHEEEIYDTKNKAVEEADESQQSLTEDKLDQDEVKETSQIASKSKCLSFEQVIEDETTAPQILNVEKSEEQLQTAQPLHRIVDDQMDASTHTEVCKEPEVQSSRETQPEISAGLCDDQGTTLDSDTKSEKEQETKIINSLAEREIFTEKVIDEPLVLSFDTSLKETDCASEVHIQEEISKFDSTEIKEKQLKTDINGRQAQEDQLEEKIEPNIVREYTYLNEEVQVPQQEREVSDDSPSATLGKEANRVSSIVNEDIRTSEALEIETSERNDQHIDGDGIVEDVGNNENFPHEAESKDVKEARTAIDFEDQGVNTNSAIKTELVIPQPEKKPEQGIETLQSEGITESAEIQEASLDVLHVEETTHEISEKKPNQTEEDESIEKTKATSSTGNEDIDTPIYTKLDQDEVIASKSKCLSHEPVIEDEASAPQVLEVEKSEEELQIAPSLSSKQQNDGTETKVKKTDAKKEVEINVNRNVDDQMDAPTRTEISNEEVRSSREMQPESSVGLCDNQGSTLDGDTKSKKGGHDSELVNSLAENEIFTEEVIEEPVVLPLETTFKATNNISEVQIQEEISKFDNNEIKEKHLKTDITCLEDEEDQLEEKIEPNITREYTTSNDEEQVPQQQREVLDDTPSAPLGKEANLVSLKVNEDVREKAETSEQNDHHIDDHGIVEDVINNENLPLEAESKDAEGRTSIDFEDQGINTNSAIETELIIPQQEKKLEQGIETLQSEGCTESAETQKNCLDIVQIEETTHEIPEEKPNQTEESIEKTKKTLSTGNEVIGLPIYTKLDQDEVITSKSKCLRSEPVIEDEPSAQILNIEHSEKELQTAPSFPSKQQNDGTEIEIEKIEAKKEVETHIHGNADDQMDAPIHTEVSNEEVKSNRETQPESSVGICDDKGTTLDEDTKSEKGGQESEIINSLGERERFTEKVIEEPLVLSLEKSLKATNYIPEVQIQEEISKLDNTEIKEKHLKTDITSQQAEEDQLEGKIEPNIAREHTYSNEEVPQQKNEVPDDSLSSPLGKEANRASSTVNEVKAETSERKDQHVDVEGAVEDAINNENFLPEAESKDAEGRTSKDFEDQGVNTNSKTETKLVIPQQEKKPEQGIETLQSEGCTEFAEIQKNSLDIVQMEETTHEIPEEKPNQTEESIEKTKKTLSTGNEVIGLPIYTKLDQDEVITSKSECLSPEPVIEDEASAQILNIEKSENELQTAPSFPSKQQNHGTEIEIEKTEAKKEVETHIHGNADDQTGAPTHTEVSNEEVKSSRETQPESSVGICDDKGTTLDEDTKSEKRRQESEIINSLADRERFTEKVIEEPLVLSLETSLKATNYIPEVQIQEEISKLDNTEIKEKHLKTDITSQQAEEDRLEGKIDPNIAREHTYSNEEVPQQQNEVPDNSPSAPLGKEANPMSSTVNEDVKEKVETRERNDQHIDGEGVVENIINNENFPHEAESKDIKEEITAIDFEDQGVNTNSTIETKLVITQPEKIYFQKPEQETETLHSEEGSTETSEIQKTSLEFPHVEETSHGTSEKEGESIDKTKTTLSTDNKDVPKDKIEGQESKPDETKEAETGEWDKVSLADLINKSTREAGKVIVEEREVKHEENDERESGSDASKEIDVKAATPKKSHNILSGVGSKVKHSISKVKKAITGSGKSSSHQKPHSPK